MKMLIGSQWVEASDGQWRDEGIWPLADFVDAEGPDAVAVTLEPNPDASIRPAAYLRTGGAVNEHLLDPDELNEYRGAAHRGQLAAIVAPLLRG